MFNFSAAINKIHIYLYVIYIEKYQVQFSKLNLKHPILKYNIILKYPSILVLYCICDVNGYSKD